MLLSLPVNPVPSELYQFFRGVSSPIWLPWYVWGGGVYATKYDYDTTKYIGYIGTVSVPLAGTSVIVKSLRLIGSVEGSTSSTEGAMVMARLYQRTSNLSSPIATIMVDRRAVPNSGLGSIYVDITQSAGGFAASASANSLAIEIIGEGQGIATVSGLVVNLQY
jgi:hypothetical protein